MFGSHMVDEGLCQTLKRDFRLFTFTYESLSIPGLFEAFVYFCFKYLKALKQFEC